MSKDVEIEVTVVACTARAILVEFGGRTEEWVAHSQITDWAGGPDDAPGFGTTSIFISEWLAIKKGMV